MNTKQYKLFFYSDDMHFEYMPDCVDYYEYIKSKVSDGHRQVIIPSKIMMDIFKDLYDKVLMKKNPSINLKRIIFIDEDSELNDLTRTYIDRINDNRMCIEELIEHLNSLFDEQLVEIRNIEFNIIDDNNIYMFNLYVNGILYIKTFGSMEECEKILTHFSQVIWSKMGRLFS